MRGADSKPLDCDLAPALPKVANACVKLNNGLSTPVTSTGEDGPAAAATVVHSTDDADDAFVITSATKQRGCDYRSRQRLLRSSTLQKRIFSFALRKHLHRTKTT